MPRRVPLILLLAHVTLVGCGGGDPAPPGRAVPPAASGWFADITTAAGIDFVHDAGFDGSYFYPQMLSAGAAMLDYDNDGDLDVYLVNGRSRDPNVPAEPNRLYRNDGTDAGGVRFTDVTAGSGLGDTGYGMGVAVADYDNDGDVDVYVTNYGPDRLYRNDGLRDGVVTFTDVTLAAGIDNAQWACSAAFFDYDRDGDLDLYVANYVDYPELKVCADLAGRPEFCGPTSSPPTSDLLYRNDGPGADGDVIFTDVSVPSGVAAMEGRGLGVVTVDLDGDGWLDVYVANDGEANFLWENRGNGTFAETAAIRGAGFNVFASTEASMGLVAGDADADGDFDLFMTHLVRESNTFYSNLGHGSFEDRSAAVGLGGPSFPFTGFGTAFVDLDQDGWLDVPVANGRVNRGRVLPGADPDHALAHYAEPNIVFHGVGDGRFEPLGEGVGGAFTTEVHVSRGLAVGDVDNDGDVDLLVNNCHGPARLYRNDAATGHWLLVRAVDPGLRRDADGAVVTAIVGDRRLVRPLGPAFSYASSNDPRAHFGLGNATTVDAIEVRWVGGDVERFDGGVADRVVVLERGAGTRVPRTAMTKP